MSLVNHPELIEDRLEPLSALEFESPAANALLTALLDLAGRQHDIDREGMLLGLAARGLGDLVGRMRESLLRQGVWQAGDAIDPGDAATGLSHALALHNKKVQLNRDLKAAELVLGQNPSEANFERLRDIQNQITTVDGTEALIEGFGSLSGRATRSF